MDRIYLDHNATTPVDPQVQRVLAEAQAVAWGNPSSLHAEGRAARHVVESARKQIARLIQASPGEVVFTSGGTESNNTAILGVCQAWAASGRPKAQLISSPLEHPSVKAPLAWLQKQGWPVHWLRVDAQGQLDQQDFALALQQPTCLVSLALCNHELGNLYPIAAMAALAHQAGALFHCDATQAVGRLPVDVNALGVDLMTLSAHKLYGPKGIGALYVAAGLDAATVAPWPLGGQQERGRRAGTESAPLIAGFGQACQMAAEEMHVRMQQTRSIRDRLEAGLLSIPGARLYGSLDPAQRASGTCNVGFEHVDGQILMMRLDLSGVSVSNGSACSSGSSEPSPVIQSLGYSRAEAATAVRFSLGHTNTAEQIDLVLSLVFDGVSHIRAQRSRVSR